MKLRASFSVAIIAGALAGAGVSGFDVERVKAVAGNGGQELASEAVAVGGAVSGERMQKPSGTKSPAIVVPQPERVVE